MERNLNRRAWLQCTGAVAALLASAKPARAQDRAAVPTTPMPPVEAYAAPPVIDQIAISPNGQRGALVTQVGDNKVILHFDLIAPKPVGVSLGPAKVRKLFFGDNDHVVLINSVTTDLPEFVGFDREFSMARAINLTTSEMNTFFSRQEFFYAIVLGDMQRIKVNGEYRVTASNYQMRGDYNLFLYNFNMTEQRGSRMHEGTSNTREWLVGPDGHIHAYCDYDRVSREWEIFYNIADRGEREKFKTIYAIREPIDIPSLEGLGRDGESIVLYLNSEDGDGAYHEMSPDGVLGPALDTQGAGRSSSPLFHPTTRRLAGFAHHDDWFTYDYFDPLMKKLAEALTPTMGKDYRVAVTDFAEDPRKMIVYGESAYDAGTYFFVDFTNGAVEPLASNYPNIPEAWITQKTPVRYKAADGLEIHGYLTLPPFKAASDLALIVLPHGGPQARDRIDFDWQAQVLASRGYAVLQPNFRGSTGYGQAFVEKGYGEWGRKMQTDLSDGVRWLASEGTIDPKRVAILGASYGGYAALAGATFDPGVYTCAVSIAGVSDLNAILSFEVSNTASERSAGVLYWKRFMGDPKLYDDYSPARQAEKASCPILLIHGTDDTVVPIDQSRRMERALKAAGKPVEFVTYKGQDHWETLGSARIDMMKSALAFLDKHNPA